jgi:hypothetical protein
MNNAAAGAFCRTGTAISGKTYCEFAMISEPANLTRGFGVTVDPPDVFYNKGGNIFKGNGGCGLPASGFANGGSVTSNAGYTFATGDRIGIAFDPATRKVWFRKNGTWISGDPAAGTGETLTLASGSTFYFVHSCYTCSLTVPTSTIVATIYPSAALQLSAAPSGFSAYMP